MSEQFPTEIEVMISFDTTMSMFPCLTQVRRKIEKMVKRLFKELPGIRIGVIAHGDYCDENTTYITKMLNLTDEQDKIIVFVRDVEPTNGGDMPECYEFVINQVRGADWTAGKKKVLILIGDDVPHKKDESQNFKKLDWKNEAKLLGESGVKIYAVHCLSRKHSVKFYQEVSELTNGMKLSLNQFHHATDMIMAICYQQMSISHLEQFEQEIIVNGHMNRSMDNIIRTLAGRKSNKSRYDKVDSLVEVNPSRFQLIEVDKDIPIKEFVLEQGLSFKKGRGFYEFSKRVSHRWKKPPKIQDYKEVILMDDKTGDFYSGNKAREIVGLPIGQTVTLRPGDIEGYTAFIQSTSVNRKLFKDSYFLYEVEDWDR